MKKLVPTLFDDAPTYASRLKIKKISQDESVPCSNTFNDLPSCASQVYLDTGEQLPWGGGLSYYGREFFNPDLY